ncbi:hypothetical protein DNTS_006454, partial [Danionella cerebrum]
PGPGPQSPNLPPRPISSSQPRVTEQGHGGSHSSQSGGSGGFPRHAALMAGQPLASYKISDEMESQQMWPAVGVGSSQHVTLVVQGCHCGDLLKRTVFHTHTFTFQYAQVESQHAHINLAPLNTRQIEGAADTDEHRHIREHTLLGENTGVGLEP